jgi:hypothetical protein
LIDKQHPGGTLELYMQPAKLIIAALIASTSLAACSTLTGAALGGAAGAAIGNNTGNGDAQTGAAIGAAAGAIAGTVADDDD